MQMFEAIYKATVSLEFYKFTSFLKIKKPLNFFIFLLNNFLFLQIFDKLFATSTDSDSNDNSDVNAFTSSRSQSETGASTGKMQFNFLVELGKKFKKNCNKFQNSNNFFSPSDPNLSSNQRINILVKKIQELKKTYLMIKNEMNAKDRRRKKLRRRERENKQKQAVKVA